MIILNCLKWFLLQKNMYVIRIKHFEAKKNDNIYQIINQKKILRIPLWFGH